MPEITRRSVLTSAGAVAAGLATSGMARAFDHPMLRAQSVSPNEKIVIGLIGCAGMGSANLDSMMRFADVEVAALCDVDSARISGDFSKVEKKYGRKPEVLKDYRRMLERKDIDAVLIATPDHWHALNLIHAVQAGKDAHCEKPISHNLVEAVAMTRATERTGRIVQVGTWQRSTPEFLNAINYVRSGKLGRVVMARCWIQDGFRAGNQQPSTPPASLDYDFWTGPARLIPYKPNHVHFNWRWFMNYGGGLTTDWGVHMMDIALLGMAKDQDLPMPVSCSAHGGQWWSAGDDRDAPDVHEAMFRFKDPDWILEWSVGRAIQGKPGHGTEWVGADGRVVRVWRGGWQILAPDGKELPKEEGAQWVDHSRDFLDRIKDRKPPRASLVSVAQTTIVCHLANIALQAGQEVRWNDARQDLEGNAGKNTLAYRREYRKPWVLPRV